MRPGHNRTRKLVKEVVKGCFAEGNLIAAHDLLRDVIAEASDAPDLHEMLTRVYRRLGDLPAAAAEARTCVTCVAGRDRSTGAFGPAAGRRAR